MNAIRRMALAAAVLGFAGGIACSKKADGAAAEGALGGPHDPTKREIAWAFGRRLGLAALDRSAASSPESVASPESVEGLARTLGVEVLPLPVPTGDPAGDRTAAVRWLTDEGGAAVVRKLEETLGRDVAALFELGVRVRAIAAQYVPGTPDPAWTTTRDKLVRTAAEAKLPEAIWRPFVAAVETGTASSADVQAVLQTMHDAVLAELGREATAP